METESPNTKVEITIELDSNDVSDLTISNSNISKEDDFFTADGELNFPRLKKRKKKVPFVNVLEETENCETGDIQSKELDPPLDQSEPETMSRSAPQPLKLNQESNILDNDMNFEGLKKKKRKANKILLEAEEDVIEDEISEKKLPVADRLMCSGDEEYTYDYLLSRFYQIATKDRPESEMSTVKITLKPPLIFRVGSKKTSFANFIDICKLLHRPPAHFMSYLLVELGTSGSLDGNTHLIIKGRFQQKQIESIIRRYIKDYVRCVTCNSLSTLLQKEIRLTFLRCENCGSRRSVAGIKTGFQALTGKRAAMRAKNDK